MTLHEKIMNRKMSCYFHLSQEVSFYILVFLHAFSIICNEIYFPLFNDTLVSHTCLFHIEYICASVFDNTKSEYTLNTLC